MGLVSVIWICGVLSAESLWGRVDGSPYWTISNQMPEEERPYTKTPRDPSTTGPTERTRQPSVLIPMFREMHRYCDGQCFYAPEVCSQVPFAFSNCAVAASVAMHNEDKDGKLYCDFFGQDNLRQSFCYHSEAQQKSRNKSGGRPDRFYTITLHRNLHNDVLSCDRSSSKWSLTTGRRCRRTEFVAISFVRPGSLGETIDFSEGDLWYVCTVDETSRSRVTMWTKENGTGSAHQILGTKPHIESGAGVVFSKVLFNEDLVSLGCQFVIQANNMSLLDSPPNSVDFANLTDNSIIPIKLAVGNVERDPDQEDKMLRPFYASTNGPPSVFRDFRIKPTDKIHFASLKVNLLNKIANPQNEEQIEANHEKKIKDMIEKCDDPDKLKDIFIVCYPPNKQKNCVHTGRCPVMFIVEIPKSDTSFNTIKASLYSSLPDYKSLRKVERPTGYASVGFSFDEKMGRDVVITCHASGRRKIGVYVSINYEQANVYPGKVDYNNLVSNTETYGTMLHSRILCTWEMPTSFIANMFDYEPEYQQIIHPGESEKLEYNFKEKSVYLLVAAGNRNYPKGKIVHHDFREVLDTQFNKTAFLMAARASKTSLDSGIGSIVSIVGAVYIIIISNFI